MTATIHKVVAGNGYQYYLRNVAAHDASSRGRDSLADYYSAHGEAPGVWHGTGLTALGIDDGAEVSEEQMKSLFGLGRHPNAELIETEVYDEQISLGAKHDHAARAADQASRLGNPYRVYAEVSAFRKRCAKAFEQHNIAHGADPHDAIPATERARIRTHVAFEMFCEEYGRAPLNARELSGWVAKNSRPNTTAVAGFDITFSPVKSVSALWAVAPRAVADKIETAHQRAVRDALGWLEQHGIFTRLGRNGVRQVDVEGIVAACFTHRDSRAGDPDLHTHVLIANRVRTLDGKWRTLDGSAIYQVVVTVSEIYNTRLEHHLEDLVGVEFAARPTPDPAKRPIREIVGIPMGLIEAWSRRETAIKGRVGELAAEFQQRFGREPIPAEMYELAQRATLETRPAKHQLRSLAEQRRTWRAEAVALLGGRDAPSRMIAAVLNPVRAPRIAVSTQWIARTADQVLEVVAEHRATWRATNVRAEVERQLRGRIRGEEWEQVTDAVLTEALAPGRSIPRGDPDVADEPELGTVPELLRRRDGASVYTAAGSPLYTSAGVLSVEAALIELSVQSGARRLSPDLVSAAVDNYNDQHADRSLNAGQISVIDSFATSGLRVHTANAPAGSGKTTAMAVLTDAWHASGGQVLGLAPTAAAAAVLGESIGARTETVDKVLDVLSRHTPHPGNPALARDIPPSLPEWVLQIGSDTLVIVDEHVKVGNLKRLRLLRFLTERGATIRCIGDDHQLPAIEAGGADADMNAAAPEQTLTLTHVVRFASTAEATASLQLREGDPAALGWYLDNARVHAGHLGATQDDAYTAWAGDHLAGRDTIMLAATHEVVTALNERARADRIARDGGVVGAEVMLADRLSASVGDTIRTRRNNPRLRVGAHDWVRNGYAWTITTVDNDGSLTATHQRSDGKPGQSVRLPADYVAAHVRLGYAATIDSAQGITTDTCHVALTGTESRQQLYVAITRGVHANHAYIPTALDGDEGSFWSEPAAYPRTAVEVLQRILGRDGAQKSAHTQLRDALDPRARIGRALDIYLDAIGVAAEAALGPDGLQRIDAAADALRPNLTDSPAYPVLRQHLATIALSGRDPTAALHAAAGARELDTADDIAAVLDWRLDPSGAHSTGIGPLPWTHGIPRGLREDSDSTQLASRARIVGDLAAQIRRDTQHWTPSAAPHWARPLVGVDPGLLGELAVWRAALHVDDRDMRPTGPRRYSPLERDHQQLLDARVTDALGDIHLPVNTWAATVERLDARIITDPYWPVLADKIALAARAGLGIASLLTDAAARRPLPDEMPAAALWSRLELEPSALDTGVGHRTLQPDWITDLHTVLGADAADRVTTDPAWPRVVAAIDRATGTNWTPRQLLATAHELLLAAQPDHATGLRPDQLASALAWRIDAVLHHTPHTPTSTPADHQPPTATEPMTTTPPQPPEPDQVRNPHLIPEPAHPPEPATQAAHPDELGAEVPDGIRRVAQLFQTGEITAAVAAFGDITGIATDEQRAILTDIADTLYRHSFPVARARLRWAGERFPQHRALIDACTPTTDPHVYQPATTPTEPAYRRDRRHETARDHHEYTDPDARRDPLTHAQTDARRAEQDYRDTRADVDDQPYHTVIPDGVAHHYYREVLPDTRAKYRPLDYDLAALPDTRGLGCVACGLERTRTDATPVPPRRADDGLCGECRDTGEPGIPDHNPADHITARCDHITATKPATAARAMLRRDWRNTRNPTHRAAIEAWIRNHPLLGAEHESRPNDAADPAADNPLFALTDDQLDERIDQLQQSLALADTDTVLYGPPQHTPDNQADTDELIRRHIAAQQAIRDSRTADQQLHTAAKAFHATATELADTRTELDATPAYRRSQRRTLQTRIDTLITEQTTRSRNYRTARAAARAANREAILLAGTADNWDHLLDTDPEPVPNHRRADTRAETNDEARTRITDISQQLDQYRAEQQRRRTLDPTQLAREQQLRPHTAPANDGDQEITNQHTEPSHRQRDDDLGL
ncbi:relaxase domain-containing protein [Nocardia abscessus]|uniref:MobF family relaxase n=1 Tax=Nocardia abscessus TaxID=120957 RepID=UPI0018959D60|nr:MobF family relaxase [Nocardia abscessus]MBF6339803.1 relaxase domain-containing protein [Nocardia abscessus]